MKTSFFNKYLADVFSYTADMADAEHIEKGQITVKATGQKFPIEGGIPRFLTDKESNYANNFGFQWKQFSKTQLDSFSSLTLSHDRFYHDSEWQKGQLKGKKVLEIGCGSGRFTEVLLESGAIVFSFDYSSAVEANYINHAKHENLFLFQGSVYDIPFPDGFFDFVFCFGVLQHTPDPPQSLRAMCAKLKSGGQLSVDNYPKRIKKEIIPNGRFESIRKYTSHWNPKFLYNFIRFYLFFWFPIDFLLRTRLKPSIHKPILYYLNIPCWNYVHSIKMPYRQLKLWAILDTFDALGARYDIRMTQQEFEALGQTLPLKFFIVKKAYNGWVLNGTKA